MISVQEAFSQIAQKKYILKSKHQATSECKGFVLAQDVLAPISLPPFNNSAVDGFAVCTSIIADAREENPKILTIGGVTGAGNPCPKDIDTDLCWHIMTGAIVPECFDAVVMQENVIYRKGLAQFRGSAIKNQHIRFAGEDVSLGQNVLLKGTRLKSNHLGLLLALGIEQLEVYEKPKVAIISTGSELVNPGETLGTGEVYYCTGPMIKGLVENFGAEVLSVKRVPDDFKQTKAIIQDGLKYDMLLVVGGISVGKYDFVKRTFESLGVKEIFYKGFWRPGKPLFFGDFEGRSVFGLPGNPVAAYTVTNVFVQKCINKMQGISVEQPWTFSKLTHEFTKKSGISQFAQVNVNNIGEVTVLQGQGSHQLGTLSQANAICWFEQGADSFQKGNIIKTMMFD